MTARGDNVSFFERNLYDNNGHLWLSNAGTGVYTAYLYDLQGNVSSRLSSQGAGHGNVDISGATSITAVTQAANLRVVNTVHDLKGNALRTDEATRSTVDAGVTVRVLPAPNWGSVVVGSTSVSNSVSVSFANLDSLGSGQVRLTISYTSSANAAASVSIYVDSDQSSPYIAKWGFGDRSQSQEHDRHQRHHRRQEGRQRQLEHHRHSEHVGDVADSTGDRCARRPAFDRRLLVHQIRHLHDDRADADTLR